MIQMLYFNLLASNNNKTKKRKIKERYICILNFQVAGNLAIADQKKLVEESSYDSYDNLHLHILS
jgi:hypothetical protein